MKDFDFDELDRAVNSVLATKKTKTTDNAADNTPAVVSDQAPQDQQAQTIQDDQSLASDAGSDPHAPNETAGANTPHIDDDAANDVNEVAEPDAVNDVHDDIAPSEITAFEPVVPTPDELDTESQPADDAQDSHESQNDVPVLDESQPAEVIETQSAGEPSSDDVAGVDTQPDDSDESVAVESTVAADPVSESVGSGLPQQDALAAIPVKRGKFMDVKPGAPVNDVKKPLATHTGITIAPTEDFDSSKSQEDAPVVGPDMQPEDVHSQEQTQELAQVESGGDIQQSESQNDSAVADEQAQHDELDESLQPQPTTTDSTPFIPDVPVEKRPLNALGSSEQSSEEQPLANQHSEGDDQTPVEDIAEPVDVTSANVPKEFNKEIMAVEANETVGAAVPQGPDSQSAAADAHPLFDTAHLGATAHSEHHAPSKITWVIILASLFLVGAALGVLYFLYGQA